MKNLNRDLLVITKKNGLDRDELEQTIIGLNTVLFQAESLTSICSANEVFDLNKYKTYTSKKDVAFYIKNKSNKPFIFISSKN
jgi:hypothetical protein